MENPNLYEDDLTEERQPTPGDREKIAETTNLDPDQGADANKNP